MMLSALRGGRLSLNRERVLLLTVGLVRTSLAVQVFVDRFFSSLKKLLPISLVSLDFLTSTRTGTCQLIIIHQIISLCPLGYDVTVTQRARRQYPYPYISGRQQQYDEHTHAFLSSS